MRISTSVIVSLRTSFQNPKTNWFSSGTVGQYSIDPEESVKILNAKINEYLQLGWQFEAVTPLAGGVFNRDYSSSENKSYGWGWGASASEYVLCIFSRNIPDELEPYFPEISTALRSHNAKLTSLETARDELDEKITLFSRQMPAEIRAGIMRKLTGWKIGDREFEQKQDAEQFQEIEMSKLKNQFEETTNELALHKSTSALVGMPEIVQALLSVDRGRMPSDIAEFFLK